MSARLPDSKPICTSQPPLTWDLWYKTQLTSQGKYTCCINPTCDFCAVHMGGCPCGKMAAMDKPVCRECKGGWEAGEGVISGKTAADIKVMPAMMGDHKM